MEKSFSQWKNQCLRKLDLSKKSSVDEGVEDVVTLLNSCEEFFTTSSCSGRIILIDAVSDSRDVQKQNCVWLFVSHLKCTPDDLMSALARSSADAVLKFEPFVLHVQCRQLEDAQLLHSVAINSGFRNSGLTVSKTGKILTAVRSTHGLEVPLSSKGKLLVDHDYVDFITKTANHKMEENLRRIQRFYQNLQASLSSRDQLKKLQISDSKVWKELRDHGHGGEAEEQEEKKTTVYKRRRKREHFCQTDCCHGDESSREPDLEDCLDLFT
ncbi:tRNA wybutosine-synthesizing protein 3 homolog [Cheilinus undulatus]|uniref:tRNA wybutosine-synthesizing protein 3 homolog n=1 Tax=Cheilinus undulatus TaxID=241271 RepID=UPI001BD4A532|nr:tRNA wybutosine-synthesizing protein 3 homolog [Cheilinus undulatus]XP_041659631.1 tRNA wybutosine-synthesizing protein 3 homolog [Cheilinus undulatus]